MQPGMPDLTQIVLRAQQMQADMERAQADLASAEVTGSAGSGLVTAVISGDGQLRAVRIDPSVVDPDDVETLGDLVVAAVRDAQRRVTELSTRAMGSVTGGLTDALGGFGFPGLPEMPGLPGFPAVAPNTDADPAAGDRVVSPDEAPGDGGEQPVPGTAGGRADPTADRTVDQD